MEGEGRKAVGLDLVFGEAVDVLEAVEGVIFGVVLPELDFGAEDGAFGGHAVLHPPGGDEDDVGELAHDLRLDSNQSSGSRKLVEVFDAEIAGDPGTVDDEGH